MIEAIIFNGLNSLDFYDVRKNVCRVPEVISRIRQAQNYIEKHTNENLDFLNFIGSDDKVFLGHIRLKSLAACIVQMGLYDRFLRHNRAPEFLVGNINGDSALQVASGVKSFETMMGQSEAFGEQPAAPNEAGGLVALQAGSDPVLSGFSISEYAVFKKGGPDEIEEGEAPYIKLEIDQLDILKIVHLLIDEYQLETLVNIGPGNLLVKRSREDIMLDQISILESIDIDPMLSWFWPSLRQCEQEAV